MKKKIEKAIYCTGDLKAALAWFSCFLFSSDSKYQNLKTKKCILSFNMRTLWFSVIYYFD